MLQRQGVEMALFVYRQIFVCTPGGSERGDAAHKTKGSWWDGIFGGVHSGGGFVMMDSLENRER